MHSSIKTKPARSRRRTVIIAAVVAVIVLGFFAHYQNNRLVVNQIDIVSDRAGSFDIVQLSDLHGKQFGEGNTRLLVEVRALTPDLIVTTGDMIDESTTNPEEVAAFMGQLTDIAPTVAVMGNHERRSDIRASFKQALLEEGVQVLDNQFLNLQLGESQVTLLGFDENDRIREASRSHEPLLEELAGEQDFRIVLTHYPHEYSLTDAPFNRFAFDLMFSGHAHGGQWVIPGIGGLIAPDQGFFPRYVRGLYHERLVVSPGLGNSILPLRFLNYPEIVYVRVNP